MSSSSLHKYVDHLEAQKELVRVAVEADPVLEIAAITDLVCKQPGGGKALLFEHPSGLSFPVATNLFGSIKRVCLALGIDSLDQLTERMSALLGHIPHSNFETLGRQIAALLEFNRFTPRSVDCDPGLAAMESSDLSCFPFLQNWPQDGSADGFGRYITLPMVYTAGPDGHTPNCGMYRCQLRGPDQLAIRWNEGSGAAVHLEGYRRAGKPMPVAIALGGPPAATFSAMFPLPGNLDEMTFAGFLGGVPMEMAACRTVPLHVPASAEFVIEGYVEPGETVTEGPFGNHTGCYSPAGEAALMRVTCVRHRVDTIIPATVVGPPPMEDCWMGKAWERILCAFLQRLVPEVADICLPLEWMFHQSGWVSLVNPQPGMVRDTAERLWQLPWFSSSRLLVFVDATDEVFDLHRAAWRAINLVDYSCDIFRDTTGRRMVIDATGCRCAKDFLKTDDRINRLVEGRWKEYGIN
ncbi:MAG TPA: UbiD family decarboxylase [Deltaproteobacteria bacterium]|nr:UbiD family decarboxylase [Deltaproteobacteria bacterium]HQB38669.1 UbiD family decarboxylase [Deltaproteobacteria bacterium]